MTALTNDLFSALAAIDWLGLAQHFLTISLLSIGGAITTVPEMQRYLVGERAWLTDVQFNQCIAVAQAAPGPNVLFVPLLGWQSAYSMLPAATPLWLQTLVPALAALVCMLAVLIPSSTLTYTATRWVDKNQNRTLVRAFKAGFAPIVIALLLAVTFALNRAYTQPAQHWPIYAAVLCSILVIWRTKVHMLWLLGAGGLAGVLGLI